MPPPDPGRFSVCEPVVVEQDEIGHAEPELEAQLDADAKPARTLPVKPTVSEELAEQRAQAAYDAVPDSPVGRTFG